MPQFTWIEDRDRHVSARLNTAVRRYTKISTPLRTWSLKTEQFDVFQCVLVLWYIKFCYIAFPGTFSTSNLEVTHFWHNYRGRNTWEWRVTMAMIRQELGQGWRQHWPSKDRDLKARWVTARIRKYKAVLKAPVRHRSHLTSRPDDWLRLSTPLCTVRD